MKCKPYLCPMQITVGQLAQLLDGAVEGNEEDVIFGPSRIEEGSEGTVSFLAHPKYEAFAYESAATALLVDREWSPKQEIKPSLIRVDDVYACVQRLLKEFENQDTREAHLAKTAIVSAKAKVGSNVAIHDYVIIEDGAIIGDNTVLKASTFIGQNAKIGANCLIQQGAKVLHECVIGNFCTLHQNAVIGSDGFGFVQNDKGEFSKIPQIGNVILEDYVDIGVNSIVDRATMGSTIIRRGVKIDNLVQVGHNVEIGENTAMAAQVGISGSSKIGKNCMIGGQVGFAGHISIADGAMFAAKAGVNSSVKEENARLCGSPAINYGTFWRLFASYKNLPELNKEVRNLKKELNALKESQNK